MYVSSDGLGMFETYGETIIIGLFLFFCVVTLGLFITPVLDDVLKSFKRWHKARTVAAYTKQYREGFTFIVCEYHIKNETLGDLTARYLDDAKVAYTIQYNDNAPCVEPLNTQQRDHQYQLGVHHGFTVLKTFEKGVRAPQQVQAEMRQAQRVLKSYQDKLGPRNPTQPH